MSTTTRRALLAAAPSLAVTMTAGTLPALATGSPELARLFADLDALRREIDAAFAVFNPLDDAAMNASAAARDAITPLMDHAASHGGFDADTLAQKAVVPVGKRVWGLALSRDGTRLYACNSLESLVSVVDTTTNQVSATIAVGQRPWGVVIDD